MGLLWRLFAPKGLKRARRKIRRAAHPIRTASWALSPKPVKKARRAAFKVAHPGEALEWAVEDQVVRSVRRGRLKVSPVVASDGATSAQVRAWARRHGYHVAGGGRLPAHIVAAYEAAHPKRR